MPSTNGASGGSSRPSSLRSDWITRTPRWVLLGMYWIIQALALYAVQGLLYESQSGVDYTIIRPGEQAAVEGEASPNLLWGQWPSRESYLGLLRDPEYMSWMGGTILVLTLAQIVFILPVRRPGLAGRGGHSLRASLIVAAMGIGLMCLAAFMTIFEFLHTVGDMGTGWLRDIPGGRFALVGSFLFVSWIVATPVLIAFTRPGRRETVLARLSKKLFIGTIIEAALLVPLDVMIRKRTGCYCDAGSYWALTICGFLGLFALGPAVFLPILAKRRATWYGGHCGVCGYDMGGRPDAPRCPECGTGWKTPRTGPADPDPTPPPADPG